MASALLVTDGAGAENAAEFEELLGAIHQDIAPVGKLEEMLVEKIAVCWWRQRRALSYEARQIHDESNSTYIRRFTLPGYDAVQQILRYETSIQRQLVHALNHLERMQRARKGEFVPAPISVHLSGDQ